MPSRQISTQQQIMAKPARKPLRRSKRVVANNERKDLWDLTYLSAIISLRSPGPKPRPHPSELAKRLGPLKALATRFGIFIGSLRFENAYRESTGGEVDHCRFAVIHPAKVFLLDFYSGSLSKALTEAEMCLEEYENDLYSEGDIEGEWRQPFRRSFEAVKVALQLVEGKRKALKKGRSRAWVARYVRKAEKTSGEGWREITGDSNLLFE